MIKKFIAKAAYAFKHQKLSRDIFYSLGSFFVLAVSGIVINIVIAGQRDAAALGVFNIAYAVYIIASQFAVWGIHYSVLRYAAYYENDPIERGRLLATALLCTLCMGCLAALVLFASEPLFERAFNSALTSSAIGNAATGLILFPFNKVLLSYLNGLRHMRAFSMLQATRYLIVMLLVSVIATSSLAIDKATFCFLVAEALTSLLAVCYLFKGGLARYLSFSYGWVRKHYAFGSRGLMAGMFAEVNSRVDVLLIGFFLSDRATGIYSFAAMLVDGLYQVLVVVRINFNPLLVSSLRDNAHKVAQKLRHQSICYVFPTALVLALCLIATYYFFAVEVMPNKDLIEGMPSLAILLFSLVVVAFLVPLDNLMLVTGYPAWQTCQQLVTVIVNATVAAALLPVVGIEGAAIGTAASYFASSIVLICLARRIHGWNLITNSFRK